MLINYSGAVDSRTLRVRLEPLSDALRRLWRNRAVTIPVVLSLALGIGANTAIFTIVDAVFLEPLPVRQPERLSFIFTTDPRNPGPLALSFPNYFDLRHRAKSFEHLTAGTGSRVNLAIHGEIREVTAELVTGNYFAMAGVTPVIGQDFGEASEGESTDLQPVIISHSLWKKRFDGDSKIVGRTVVINKVPFQVSGVMPQGFKGFERIGYTDIWMPMRAYKPILERPDWMNARRALMFYIVGRLNPGVSIEQAAAETQRIGIELAAEHPNENTGRSFRVMSLEEARYGPEHRNKLLRAAALVMGAAGVVLFIAIANVGNVLLSRAAVRRREMAVRVAIGATRRTLLKQIFYETALIVALGGTLGLLVAILGKELLWLYRPDDMTAEDLLLPLNARVLTFAALLSLVTGFLASLLPALQALRGNITSELRVTFQANSAPREFARPRTERANLWQRMIAPVRQVRFREVLVVSQIALSLVALMGADAFLKSLSNARAIDPGFDTRSLASFSVNPRRLGLQGDERTNFYLTLQQKLAAVPGARSVAISSNPLLGPDQVRRTVLLDGSEASKSGAFLRITMVSTGYFETTDQLILRGRDFSESDCSKRPLVAIVNEAMVKKYWPGEQAIGKQFRLFGDREKHTVVGVARDSMYSSFSENPEPSIFVPLMQTAPPTASVIIRTAGDPVGISAAVTNVMKAQHPELPLPEIISIRQAVDRALWAPRMAAALLSIFGLIALALASVGVYAVTTHMVSQRTAELGVRMAMGACPVDVLELILRQCFRLVLPGLAVGCVVSFVLSRFFFESLLFNVKDTDLEPYLVTSLILAIVALAASYLPARRAIRMHPVLALREQ
jgi:predicted permease